MMYQFPYPCHPFVDQWLCCTVLVLWLNALKSVLAANCDVPIVAPFFVVDEGLLSFGFFLC